MGLNIRNSFLKERRPTGSNVIFIYLLPGGEGVENGKRIIKEKKVRRPERLGRARADMSGRQRGKGTGGRKVKGKRLR